MEILARLGRTLRTPKAIVTMAISAVALIVAYFVSPLLFAVLIMGGVLALGVAALPAETNSITTMLAPPGDGSDRNPTDDSRRR